MVKLTPKIIKQIKEEHELKLKESVFPYYATLAVSTKFKVSKTTVYNIVRWVK